MDFWLKFKENLAQEGQKKINHSEFGGDFLKKKCLFLQ